MITINFTVVCVMRSSQRQQEKTCRVKVRAVGETWKLSKDELEAVQRGDQLTDASIQAIHKF